jgi:endonuclease-3
MPARLSKLKRSGTPHREEAARPVKDPRRRLVRAIDLLDANLGVAVWDGRKDALEVLVLTILSQNTTDPNALRGYQNLAAHLPGKHTGKDASKLPRDAAGNVDKVMLRLSNAAVAVEPPDWARVAKLKQKQLADYIRAAGLPDAKSGAILALLGWLDETVGEYSLDKAIDKLGVDAAMEALSGLKGIGVKTIGVTLIEALGVDLCPVDTHVHRIINRLGVVDTKSNRDKTFTLLKPLIPSGRAYSLHHNLLTFGRTVCTAKRPDCNGCFLRKLCPSAKALIKAGEVR